MVRAGPEVSVPPGGGMAVRVTLTVRETLPVASAATTVIVLTPIASGIFDMTQLEPLIDAPSDAPMLFVQRIAGPPLPPVTVPVSDMVAAVVGDGGASMVRTRGPGGGLTVRVTLTTWETLPVASAAVTVMVFSPIASGMFEMIQLEPLIDDPSNAPILLVQLTAGAPLPPVTVPVRDMVAAVVGDKGALIFSTRGPGGIVTVRVTVTACETLPVASSAVTVMVLTPIASGMLKMAQFPPLIVDPSDAPVLVIQCTDGEPLPPVTVPDKEMVASAVVARGVLIVSTSGPGGGATVRVTLTMWEVLPVASVAVTVMVLTPIARGILNMVQVSPLIEDPSEAPVLVIQVTDGDPLPPVTVPDSEMVAEVVVAGGTLIVKARGPATTPWRVMLTT
jgi:uncharacterized membrane protein (DUF441 family)